MGRQRYTFLTIIILIVFVSGSFIPVLGHSGRTDSSGGHHDYNNVSGLGSYHYHHGYSAHLHPGGVCPYEQNNVASSANQTSKQNNALQNAYSDGYSAGYSKGFESAKTYYKDRYNIMKEDLEGKITELQDKRDILFVFSIAELLVIIFSFYRLYKVKKGGRLNS